ncbi:MAG: transporter substrate-binding domain-containing protein [Rhodospirillales bacterium]|nr:transporter substrate-binding domain-containing protein [Rhodospirillales bacterium]
MKTILRTTLLTLALASFITPTAFANDTLTLNTVGKPPFSTVMNALLSEAFKRVGLNIKVQELPGRRALKNANEGIDDGDTGRVKGTEKRYPNLMVVPESILSVHIVGFGKNINSPLEKKWGDLEPYNVGILRGHQHSERMVTSYKSLVKVDNTDQLLKLLDKDRADIVVTVQIEGLSAIKKADLKGIKILQPPLEVVPIYTYLHKKHAKHIEKLDKAIKEMKADGTYAKIRDGILGPYYDLVGQ